MLDLTPAGFCWATGIENTFIPHIRPGFRALDEYALTQHYQQWKTDIDLVAETGVRALRWGIPVVSGATKTRPMGLALDG